MGYVVPLWIVLVQWYASNIIMVGSETKYISEKVWYHMMIE